MKFALVLVLAGLAVPAGAAEPNPFCTDYVVIKPQVLERHVRATFYTRFSAPELLLSPTERRAAAACVARGFEALRPEVYATCLAGGFSASESQAFEAKLEVLANLCIGNRDWTE